MLLRVFKANYFYNFLLFPIVGSLLLLKSFLYPGAFTPEISTTVNPLLKPLYELQLTQSTAVIINFIAVMIICLQLLLINASFSFVRERTFLPVYLFMFIVLALPDLHVIQPVFIATIFMLIALHNIFLSFDKKKVVSNGFNAGFFTGLAALFYPGLFILFFLVPISLYTLKHKIGIREWIASLLGLVLPSLYTFTYFFLTDNISSFYEIFTSILAQKNTTVILQLPVIIYLSYIAIITIAASMLMLRQYDEKKISTRIFFKILFFYFSTSLLLLIIPSVSHELLVIVTLPLTFLITNYLNFIRSRFWAELIFTLFIFFSIVLQFLVK